MRQDIRIKGEQRQCEYPCCRTKECASPAQDCDRQQHCQQCYRHPGWYNHTVDGLECQHRLLSDLNQIALRPAARFFGRGQVVHKKQRPREKDLGYRYVLIE